MMPSTSRSAPAATRKSPVDRPAHGKADPHDACVGSEIVQRLASGPRRISLAPDPPVVDAGNRSSTVSGGVVLGTRLMHAFASGTIVMPGTSAGVPDARPDPA